MLFKKSHVVSSLVIVLLQGTKCAIFVSVSTITYIVSKKLDGGKLVMKSIEIEDQEHWGISNGCRSPYDQCHGFLDLEQMSQKNTKSLIAFHI